MRVAVTGSTGLIGETLVDHLADAGHRIHRVVRSRDRVDDDEIYWSVERGEIDAAAFEGTDAVVHLAGEPLGGRGLRRPRREAVWRSRVEGTRLLAGALASLDRPPGVLVSASAVGYYGDRGSAVVTEDDPPGDTFMARLCVAWEGAAAPAAEAGIRVVHPRTGVVMARRGPLIEKVHLPFSLGLGGRVGSGDQYHPWIALEDEVRALALLLRGDLAGPVNLTGPAPVTNAELTQALGEVMNRPTVLWIPPLAIRLLYGGLAAELATESQRVLPRRLLDAGFTFVYPDLRSALRAALG